MTNIHMQHFNNNPVIAILRGLEPEEACDIAQALLDAGISMMEVPLNRPGALEAIGLIAAKFSDKVVVGAGTVLTCEAVINVKEAGGSFIVAPNTNTDVIDKTKELGLQSCPGVYTASEAFTAIQHGADFLKLFPCDGVSPKTIKALKTVLPENIPLLCVGGINENTIPEFLKAGADGFGIGSNIFKPGDDAKTVYTHAKSLMDCLKACS
jgi:2-dehydro-3-deoxyphosphogalactonate aldolase